MAWEYLGWLFYFSVIGESALIMFCELNECGSNAEFMGKGDTISGAAYGG